MERIPKPNEIYQHFKGNLYKVLTLAKHSETGEWMVVYQALYGTFDIYVRPLESFMSEVDHEKYPEVSAKYRFTEILPVMELQGGEILQEPETVLQEKTLQQEVTRQEEIPTQEETDVPDIDPIVMAFLDAETHKEKLDILLDVHERITDAMINTMAVSLDLEVGEGSLEDRYWELKNCLLTLEKYEIDRLR